MEILQILDKIRRVHVIPMQRDEVRRTPTIARAQPILEPGLSGRRTRRGWRSESKGGMSGFEGFYVGLPEGGSIGGREIGLTRLLWPAKGQGVELLEGLKRFTG